MTHVRKELFNFLYTLLVPMLFLLPCKALVASSIDSRSVTKLREALRRTCGEGYLPQTIEGQQEVERYVAEIETAQGSGPCLQTGSAPLVEGKWKLIFSSNRLALAGGGRLIAADGLLTDIQQDINFEHKQLVNRVCLKPWPSGFFGDALAGEKEAMVTLELEHDFRILSAAAPCRIEVSLRKVKRRFSGGSGPLASFVPKVTEIDLAKTFIYGDIQKGAFDVTGLIESQCECGELRIARGTGPLSELRIFEKVQ